MTDEKKLITLDEMDVQNMTAEEMELVALRNDVQMLTEKVQVLQMQYGAMQDMARMNAAAACLPHIVAELGSDDLACDRAIELSDALISRYEAIMEGKIREHMRRQAEGEGGEQTGEAVN